MRLHRFFLPFDITAQQICIEDPAIVHQMKNVFRYKRGDRVILCDGKDNEAVGEIMGITQQNIIVTFHTVQKTGRESSKHAFLLYAMTKRDTFEMLVQKATEIGISEIFPVITKFTVKTGFKSERIHTIAQEASEQSGRGIVPVIHEPKSLQDTIAFLPKKSKIYFCDETGNNLITKTSVQTPSISVGMCIGPEGGWSEEELAFATAMGWEIVSFGPRVLRAETAGIVASYLLVHHDITISK